MRNLILLLGGISLASAQSTGGGAPDASPSSTVSFANFFDDPAVSAHRNEQVTGSQWQSIRSVMATATGEVGGAITSLAALGEPKFDDAAAMSTYDSQIASLFALLPSEYLAMHTSWNNKFVSLQASWYSALPTPTRDPTQTSWTPTVQPEGTLTTETLEAQSTASTITSGSLSGSPMTANSVPASQSSSSSAAAAASGIVKVGIVEYVVVMAVAGGAAVML